MDIEKLSQFLNAQDIKTNVKTITSNTLVVWKLGDHKEGILPKKSAANKLIHLIKFLDLPGNHLIWDSLINFEVINLNHGENKNE